MSKKFTALVADRDPGQSGKIISILEKIFTSVMVQSSPRDVEKDYLEDKPNAIFINLNITQRESSFALIEKIQTLSDNPPMIFAYLDGHEPELISHAIENGVLDVFMRPFDADVIASKLNRFLKDNNSKVESDLHYTKLYKPFKAQVELGCKLVSVDENGMMLSSEHYISKGTKFQIPAALSAEIFGTDSVPMMVTKTSFEEETALHFFFAEPREQKESLNAALRRFIMSKL